MSLLLEALKRAERQRQQPEPPPAGSTDAPRQAKCEVTDCPKPMPASELSVASEPQSTQQPHRQGAESFREDNPEPARFSENMPMAEMAHSSQAFSLAEPPQPAAAIIPLAIVPLPIPEEPSPPIISERIESPGLEATPLEIATPASPHPVDGGPQKSPAVQETPTVKIAPSPFADGDRRERPPLRLGTSPNAPGTAHRRKHQLALVAIALAVAVGTASLLLWLERQTTPTPLVQANTNPEAPPVSLGTPSDTQVATAPPEPEINATLTSAAKPFPLPIRKTSLPRVATPSPTPSSQATSPGIRRTDSQIITHPATADGYAAMANGNLVAAREHYQQALGSDQRSRDAILGLAVTALREGHDVEAVQRYEQLLALNPHDPDANAGLALLRGAMDPVAYESRLRNLMDERESNAALHHALGSLLARQHRWGEAQESFFRATTLAPRSADYLFNLAVALDHLGQYAQARAYYRQALDFPPAEQGTFNREAAKSRMAALEALTR